MKQTLATYRAKLNENTIGRKFSLALIAFALVTYKVSDPVTFCNAIEWILGIFCTGDVVNTVSPQVTSLMKKGAK